MKFINRKKENNTICILKISANIYIENFSKKNFDLVNSLKKSNDFWKFKNIENLDSSLIAEFLSLNLKNQGIMDYLFLSDKEKCGVYENGMMFSYYEKKFNVAVYLDECVYQLSRNGSIILVNSNMADSTSYEDYVLSSVRPFLSVLSDNNLSKTQIQKHFLSVNENCSYCIVNIQNSQRVLVGNVVNSQVTISNNVVYFEILTKERY